MAGRERGGAQTAPLAVVLTADRWNGALRAWVRAWRRECADVVLVVVDRSPGGEVYEAAPDQVQVVQGHRGTTAMALNVGLEVVQAARVLFLDSPRVPPAGFVDTIEGLDRHPACTFIGPGAPPAGVARTALDILMLHMVPADAVSKAPARWSSVPGAFWAVFGVEALRATGGLDAAESHFELAIQEACVRQSRRRAPVLLSSLPWSVERRSVEELAEGVRELTAARILRLSRRPDTALEPGWSLATCSALQTALERDPMGHDRQRILEQLGSVDLSPMARMREWAPLARDQLRNMLVALRQQQQRWVLDGLLRGLELAEADGIPTLLARHPIRIGAGATVVLPAERDDVVGLHQAITGFFRSGHATRCTLAVVAGPTTSSRLRLGMGREWRSLELMAALAGSELLLHPMSLTASTAIRVLASASAWVPVDRLQGEAWALHARVVGTRPMMSARLAAWPLDVARPVRLVAWPDWSDFAALGRFVRDVMAPLVGRSDVTLVLRLDPTIDGDPKAAQARLQEAVSAGLPEDADIELLVLTEPMDGNIPARVGLGVHAWVGEVRHPDFTQSMGAPVYRRPSEVLSVWDGFVGAADFDAPTLQ